MLNKLAFLKPATGLTETLRRFPLSVLCSIVLFFLVVCDNKEFILPAIYGYFWFGAAALIAERHKLSFLWQGILSIGGIGFLFLITNFDLQANIEILYLVPSLLLLVIISPFIDKRSDDNGEFWAYNYILWSGVGAAVVTAVVMTVGLSAALLSVQYLFGLSLTSLLRYLWIFGMAVFAPIYALFWVPKKVSLPDAQYTQACKILVNIILIPLICIYFLILYVYAGKILIEWEMPRGKLAMMVAGFGAVGVVTYMVAWPIRDSGTKLLGFVQKHFFKFMIVPLTLMGIGLSIRIEQYGITEQRYMAVIAMLWLSFITLLFISNRKFPLKLIPGTLALLLFTGSFGPWGAVAMSTSSQTARLNALLTKNNILVNGEIIPVEQGIPFEDEKNISSIVDYFVDTERVDQLPGKLDLAADSEKRKHKKKQKIMEVMALQYLGSRAKPPKPEDVLKGKEFKLKDGVPREKVLEVAGYDYLLNSVRVNNGKEASSDFNGEKILYLMENGILKVVLPGPYEALSFNIDGYAAEKLAQETPAEKVGEMVLIYENDDLKAKLFLSSINGHIPDGKIVTESINFRMLLSYKSRN